MDLILLQPGNPDIFGEKGRAENGGSLIDGMTHDNLLDLGRCIELVSIQHGMRQQISQDAANTMRPLVQPTITEITCVKYVDKMSVKFYEYCLRAEPLGKGAQQPTKLYIARNSGDKTASVFTIELRDAIISEIQMASHPDDMPTEQFKLNFTEILWHYSIQHADMGHSGDLSAGWSLARNRPIAQFTE